MAIKDDRIDLCINFGIDQAYNFIWKEDVWRPFCDNLEVDKRRNDQMTKNFEYSMRHAIPTISVTQRI